MRFKGRITAWNDDRGFGFISPSGGGKQVFVHVKAFDYGSRRPELNRLVTYAESTDAQGRPCAVKVHMAADQKTRQPRRRSTGRPALLVAVGFLVALALLATNGEISLLVVAIYCIASVATFAVYWADKSAAKQSAGRVPENTLHGLSLFCGWPGALAAQSLLRHKTLKQPFRFVFWVTVVTNVTALACLLFLEL